MESMLLVERTDTTEWSPHEFPDAKDVELPGSLRDTVGVATFLEKSDFECAFKSSELEESGILPPSKLVEADILMGRKGKKKRKREKNKREKQGTKQRRKKR